MININMQDESELQNPDLKKQVNTDNDLKQMVVDYVGNKLKPDTKEVTLQMVVDVLADEFPEFVLALAEENFIRGYEQALSDKESLSLEK